MPIWIVSIPLLITATSWVIIGLGMLIKEEYWEFQMIRSGLIGWAICGFVGAGLIILGYLEGDHSFGLAGVIDLIGLVLIFLSIIMPAWVDYSSIDNVVRFAHVWDVLLIIIVRCLMLGMVWGGSI